MTAVRGVCRRLLCGRFVGAVAVSWPIAALAWRRRLSWSELLAASAVALALFRSTLTGLAARGGAEALVARAVSVSRQRRPLCKPFQLMR